MSLPRGVTGIWTVAYIWKWYRKKRDQAKSKVCDCLLRTAKSKADSEAYAEDSQKAESPGIKIAVKLDVSKYPVTQGKVWLLARVIEEKDLEVDSFMKISSKCLAERNWKHHYVIVPSDLEYSEVSLKKDIVD